MRANHLVAAVLILAALMPPPVLAQRKDKLESGDEAPGLEVETWVAGQHVAIQQGSVYVLIFTESVEALNLSDAGSGKPATRLGELYELYKDQGLVVAVITSETAEQLQEEGAAMERTGISVGVDRRNSTRRAWVERSGNKVPVAFIVGRDKRIRYIGQLRDTAFTRVLERILVGRYDPALRAKAEAALGVARRARRLRNWRLALQQYDEVIKTNPEVLLDVAMERLEMTLGREDMADPETGYAYVRELLDKTYAADAGALRQIAETIATDPDIADEIRDLDLASTAAEKALRLGGAEDPDSLATLALVRFRQGRLREAVELQKQAYFIAHPRLKPAFRRVLDTYMESAADTPKRQP
jgi:tetratricopeptide (TPR) repeat protein